MDLQTVCTIRKKLATGEWHLLHAALRARGDVALVLKTRPLNLSDNARRSYEWVVRFVEESFWDVVWHLRASPGFSRLSEQERTFLEAEVFQIPSKEAEQVEQETGDQPLFESEAAELLLSLTPNQQHYLQEAWNLTRQITRAVNRSLAELGVDDRAAHERQVRTLSHHYVQMQSVLHLLADSQGLASEDRERIRQLLVVHFQDTD